MPPWPDETQVATFRPSPASHPERWLRLALGGLLLVGLVVLAIQVAAPPAQLPILQRRILQGILVLLLTVFGWRAATDREHRWGWVGFALMFGIHLLASLARDLQIPGLLHVAVFAYLPFGVWGFLGWTPERGVRHQGLRRPLEGLIFSLSILALSWLGLRDLPSAAVDRIRWDFVEVGIPAALLGVALFQVLDTPRRIRGPIGWIGLHFLAANLFNLWQLRALYEGWWSSTHLMAYLDPLILLGASTAAFLPWPIETSLPDTRRDDKAAASVLIYLPFSVALTWLVVEMALGMPPDPVLVWFVVAITYLLILRQILAMRDLSSFSNVLEIRLNDQRRVLDERQEALREALRLAEAGNEAKALFLSRMGHELRTPVNHVLLKIQLIESGWPGEPDPETAQDFSDLRRSGKTLEGLIHDLLTFCDLGAGRIVLAAAPVHLPGLCDDVAGMFRPMAEAKGLALRLEIDPDLPGPHLGDETRLFQVLKELVSNAVKYCEKGHVQIRLLGAGDAVRIEVLDTGVGIPVEEMDRIFEPFEQADGSLQRRHGGTGLGLALVKRSVDLMGGTLGLEPRAGGGTRVWVELKLPLEAPHSTP